MKIFKSKFKIILALLLLVSTVFSFVSCDREYDAATVEAEAEKLIKESILLNEIFWGKGIAYVEDSSSANGAYYMAHFLSLSEYGVETIEDIKTKARAVFSERYSNLIFSTIFDAISDSDGIQIMARYYQKYEDAEETIPDCIMVYSYAENDLTDEVEYLYETITATHSEDDKVFVNIEVNITRTFENGEKKTQRSTKTIALYEEEYGWRIDSSTYCKYNEFQDKYEELDKK